MNLKAPRKKVDSIDRKIVELLNTRVGVAKEISQAKQKSGQTAYSPERETDVLRKISSVNCGPLSQTALEAIYAEIMSASLSLNKTLAIAYLGPEATFTHLAALKKFGSQVSYLPCKCISEIFWKVQRNDADYGVVPVENSTEGAVSYTLDMFVDSDLKICNQFTMDITQNLLANCSKKRIKTVYSNPNVLGQCRLWLEENLPKAEKIEVPSTTRAAQIAAKQKDTACIASLLAAKIYKLRVIASGIEDSPHNITRFFVIGKTDVVPTKHDKTSILFSIKDRVGALHDMLVPFKKYGINLTKIESRPSKKKAWDYYFYIDLEGHRSNPSVKKALDELESKCKFLKILGSYPITE